MVVSPAWDRNAEALRERSLSPAWDRNAEALRERSLSPALDHDLTARSSTGIVPKQLQKNNAPGEGIVAEHFEDGALAATAKGRAAIASGYFDAATAADKFVDGSIPPAKINGGVGGGAATALKTTGADVVISGAAPPSTGQVLKATSATTATWQAEAGGGGNVAVGARLKKNAMSLSVVAGESDVTNYDSVPDNDGCTVDLVIGTITVPQSGWYAIIVHASFLTATGAGEVGIKINGTAIERAQASGNTSGFFTAVRTTYRKLVGGDVIKAFVQNNSSVDPQTVSPILFEVVKVG